MIGQPRAVAAVALAIVAISWGTIPLIVREDVAVSHLVGMRVTLGAAALLGYLAVRGGSSRPPAIHLRRIVAAGVVLAVHWALFFASVKATDVAVALSVVFLGPVVAAVLAPRVLGEKAARAAYVGLALAFAGVLLVVRPGSGATLEGVTLAGGAAVTFAVVILIAKPAAEALGGLVVAAGELATAAVLLAPWTARAAIESREFWAQFLVLGVLLTGVGFVVFWHAMRHLPVVGVGVLTYLEPAFAVIWAGVFLSETPAASAWLGVALVIVGGSAAAVSVAAEPVPTAGVE